MYSTISFAPEEKISLEKVLEFGVEFANRYFTEYQSLIAVHENEGRISIHLITNTVSYIDGLKLHTSQSDLQKMKDLTNEMCKEKGLIVTEKGKHFDGTDIKPGEIAAWEENKYCMLTEKADESYIVDCVLSILEAKKKSCDKEDFVKRMFELGWKTNWSDKKDYITFENADGKKVKNTNISKSFSVDLSTATLLNSFKSNKDTKA